MCLMKMPDNQMKRNKVLPLPLLCHVFIFDGFSTMITFWLITADILPRFCGFSRKGREPFSPRRGGDIPNDAGSKLLKNLATTNERGRNKCTVFFPEKEEGTAKFHERENESSHNQGGDAYGSNYWEKPRNQVAPTGSVTGSCTNQAVVRSGLSSGVASETSTTTLSTGTVPYANNENEKIWHYQDPAGKIQGPFSMVQLRKWSANGHFPPDLRIWRLNEKQDDSLLLTDAMNSPHSKELPLLNSSLLQSRQVRAVSKGTENNWDARLNGGINATWIGNKLGEWPGISNAATTSNGNNEHVKRDGWGSCSSSWSTPVDVANSKEVEISGFSQSLDSLKGNTLWSDQPKVYSSLPSSTVSGNSLGNGLHRGKEDYGVERWDPGQNHRSLNSHRTAAVQVNNGSLGQSLKENCRPLPMVSSSSGWDSNFDVVSVGKLSKTMEQDHNINISDLPSPTPKPNDGDWKGQTAESKQSVSSDVPVQDSGPSWSSASSLVGGGTKLPEVANGWGGYSPTPVKASIDEWDSTIASVSSLKPAEATSDHAATPTSESVQLTHSSPPYPTPNASSWQAIDTGPTEFSSLTEASVSDLLAEVEAMESLDGPPSPTSVMNCSGDLTQGSKNDCFDSVEGLSPTPDPAKNDALSSTGDFQLTSQSTMRAEPCGPCHADVLDADNKCMGQSSSSDKVEMGKKPGDGSVTQWEAGSEIQPPASSMDVAVSQWKAGADIQPPASSTASWHVSATDNAGSAVSGTTTDSDWRTVQGNPNLDWGRPTQGNIEMGWQTSQGMAQGNANVNWSTSTGNFAVWGGQSKYSGGRTSGPRDRGAFQVGETGFDRGRTSLSRQSSLGGGGAGGFSYRNPPKGQRVCKFFESGYCKKGAACDYLHP